MNKEVLIIEERDRFGREEVIIIEDQTPVMGQPIYNNGTT